MGLIEYNEIKNYLNNLEYPIEVGEERGKKIRNRSKKFRVVESILFKIIKGKKLEVLNEPNIKQKVASVHYESHEGIENTWRRAKEIYFGE
ncbi:hypothetical protein AYI69_g7388 [Smittium culicis]|uniref:Uncharacterized protein n=1 Tax=Smittium culicis TaxID=133412 RepID=A0A1R1XS74_9FUNG|nr:hypothetical protein AYI69_g7388 [Smittium culicis]